MAIDPNDLVDASDEPALPDGLTPPDGTRVLITWPRTDPAVTPPTYGMTLVQLRRLLLPVAAPAAAPPTFTGFADTQAGGSVQLVVAPGVPMADYRYKVGAAGNYQAAPVDGLISVGNVDGAVYAYSVAATGRAESPVAASPPFASYAAPVPVNVTPAAPTFANFQDTAAGGSVQLVPAPGVPFTDYFYKVGPSSNYQPAPLDGLISVGDVAGSVYAYSVANPGAGRNASLVGTSAAFTVNVPVPIPVPVPPPAPAGNPTFFLTLNPGDNVAAMMWSASPGVLLRYNNPVAASSPTQGNNMQVYYPAGNQVAGFDYAKIDEGHACAVTIGPTTYYHNAAGALLTFTNGPITLAL